MSGLAAGTPVSAAANNRRPQRRGRHGSPTREGSFSLIAGHVDVPHGASSRELRLFDGYAGVVKDGIIPGFNGYESGQSAVGDIFGWFAKGFMNLPFEELSSESRGAQARRESGSLRARLAQWQPQRAHEREPHGRDRGDDAAHAP